MNNNPIIIIDDDEDDLEFLKQAFIDLGIDNEIIIFSDGHAFLDYMSDTEQKTFFILCDINMAKINGLELKQRIFEDERLRMKCMPFIFLSTSAGSAAVMRAYSFGVQGYFIKPPKYEDIMVLLQKIIAYWTDSQHPNL